MRSKDLVVPFSYHVIQEKKKKIRSLFAIFPVAQCGLFHAVQKLKRKEKTSQKPKEKSHISRYKVELVNESNPVVYGVPLPVLPYQ